jgi:hypothetical protein
MHASIGGPIERSQASVFGSRDLVGARFETGLTPGAQVLFRGPARAACNISPMQKRRHSIDLNETKLQIKQLAGAAMKRRSMARGTPEYAAALGVEENLAARIWRDLGTARQGIIHRPVRDSRNFPNTRKAASV